MLKNSFRHQIKFFCKVVNVIWWTILFLHASCVVRSGNKCNKCREESAYVVLRSKHGYCKNCFISGTTHKFKSLLGKHRIITQNENVLVYHKGGHASTALLHFLRSGLDLKTPKQLRLKPLFLYIEGKTFNTGFTLSTTNLLF